MIVRTLFRMIWVVIAFAIAALAALAVLFGLGAIWAGDELRAAAPPRRITPSFLRSSQATR